MPAIEAIPRNPQVIIDIERARAVEQRDRKPVADVVSELVNKARISCSAASCCLSATCETLTNQETFGQGPVDNRDAILVVPEMIAVTVNDSMLGHCEDKVHFVKTVASARELLI